MRTATGRCSSKMFRDIQNTRRSCRVHKLLDISSVRAGYVFKNRYRLYEIAVVKRVPEGEISVRHSSGGPSHVDGGNAEIIADNVPPSRGLCLLSWTQSHMYVWFTVTEVVVR